MTKAKPSAVLSWSDIPQPVPGAARYSISPKCSTGGHNIIMFAVPDGHRSTIEHKPSEQSAFRAAIRWQKRENAAVSAENKRRQKNVAA